MSEQWPPFGENPVRRIYLLLDARGDGELLRSWLESILERANWRCHLFLMGDEGPGAPPLADGLLPAVVWHLERNRFGTIALHPMVRVGSRFKGHRIREWQGLVPQRQFQVEAYQEQGESRLMVHPMIAPQADADVGTVLDALRLAGDELVVPSLLLEGDPPAGLLGSPEVSELRVLSAQADNGRGDVV
jgi:hypothetical protein